MECRGRWLYGQSARCWMKIFDHLVQACWGVRIKFVWLIGYVLDWLTGPSSASINELTPQKLAVREFQSAAFKCTVGGSPRPNVTWIRGKEIIADCDGRQYGKCNNRGNSRYKVQWKDERGCMLNHSMGQVSGTWISSLRFPNTRFPADAMEYACVVSNGIGPARRQHASLEIYG